MINELALSETEVHKLTGYARPTKQLEVLRGLGVPARRRPDNTLLVLRMHCIHPVANQVASNLPKLKSSRK